MKKLMLVFSACVAMATGAWADAAAVAEIVEAEAVVENSDPEANQSETDRQAQEDRNALKNAGSADDGAGDVLKAVDPLHLELKDWFTENAQSVDQAMTQGGETQDGVWSNLTDQVEIGPGNVVIDADDETPVAYRPKAALRGNSASVILNDITFTAARKALPALETGTQAAVAITTNAKGECVFAVANGGVWEVTTQQAQIDGIYKVKVDFHYGDVNTVDYSLAQADQWAAFKSGAVNPAADKVSTVEFAGNGKFGNMSGKRELANYTISFTGIPAGIAEITVDGTPVDEDGKATVAEGLKNVVIGFVAKSGYRVSPETKTLPGPIDGNISYTAENFPVKVFKWVAGVTVNGTDVSAGSGTGWTYDGTTHTVEIADAGSYVLSGTNTEGEVMFAVDSDAAVTLSNLCLRCTTDNECCIWATNDVAVTLYLAGTNTLGGGLCVENGTHLVVTNALGFADADAVLIAEGGLNLTAIAVGRSGPECAKPTFEIAGGTVYANWEWGVYGAAGIGTSLIAGTDGEAVIVISGGRVFARGGQHAPGIGGAYREKSAGAPDIWITGGYVEAVGGQFAAGIGGADGGKYGSATVSGGTVRVTRGDNAFDMLAGTFDDGGGDFTVTGGSIWLADGALVKPVPSNGTDRVWWVVVRGVTTVQPKIEGLPMGYGTKDIVAVDGKIHLWLPDGEYDFIVGGKTYKANVAGANTEAVEQPATPLAPGHSSDPFDSETEAWAAVNGGLISFGPTDKVKEVLEASTILTVDGYKAMFTPVVCQAKEDGKWRVMYELTASATNTLMQSIHDVVTKIDLTEITTEGVASMSLDGGIPGIYYTLFTSDAVTTVTEPSSRDKENSDRLCDEDGFVFFWNVEKPSDAAGFFTVSVSPEQAFTSGEPSADVRGGGIIVLPPVITTGSDD